MNGRIAIVGSYPPCAPCGVADYSEALATALQQAGLKVARVTHDHWGPGAFFQLSRKLKRVGPAVVHLQYPTAAYGWSLTPHTLAMLYTRAPLVITLHEFSAAHPLRRLASMAFLRAAKLIFTTELERARFATCFPCARKKSSVIPIAANLPAAPLPNKQDPHLVVYFGLIRPQKGIEDFIKLAYLSQAQHLPFKFTIIGRVRDHGARYAAKLKKMDPQQLVHWISDLDAPSAAATLAGAQYAYLPFPDGASARRGSLLASLAARLAIITTRGTETPTSLSQAVEFAADPTTALALLRELSADPIRTAQLRAQAALYSRAFTWSAIAEAHEDLYKRLLDCPPKC